ncbi:DUF1249 domain-containing protein [Spartinivicinus poritis]|uniref:DUF1249 domain-containing protein n=1 Tax=Spartinivicinus poritis TaxID=2994640 RepID=A0ABT5U6D2_9GAMM|nr:DUF1249 domain-containing protein [Spartinivicinus sp. A2-2]MDE1461915.1 DUF1249 domain-containing protein [Spartinivicinus sp. A2-2]
MRKAGYKVDLVKQQAVCEANYFRLCKLLPGNDEDLRRIAISHGSYKGILTLKVVERCKYTSVISLIHDAEWGEWAITPLMSVRVYHDVQMAEVISAQQKRHFAAKYSYPNPQMFHPDEKAQLNRFLADWLAFCLEQGHSYEPVSLSS